MLSLSLPSHHSKSMIAPPRPPVTTMQSIGSYQSMGHYSQGNGITSSPPAAQPQLPASLSPGQVEVVVVAGDAGVRSSGTTATAASPASTGWTWADRRAALAAELQVRACMSGGGGRRPVCPVGCGVSQSYRKCMQSRPLPRSTPTMPVCFSHVHNPAGIPAGIPADNQGS